MPAYIVAKPFEHRGRTAAPGERLELSGRQAFYLQLGGKITPAAAEKKKPRREGAAKAKSAKK